MMIDLSGNWRKLSLVICILGKQALILALVISPQIPKVAGMFISLQKHKCFQTTIYSAIEVTKFLLNQGVEFARTESFCRRCDNLVKLGRRCDNPDVHVFGYNANALHIQRSVIYVWEQLSGNKFCCPELRYNFKLKIVPNDHANLPC